MTDATDGDGREASAELEERRDEVREAERWIRERIRQRPLAAFCAAVASGYLLARIVRR